MNNLRLLFFLILLLFVVIGLQSVFVKKEVKSISPTPSPTPETQKEIPTATPTPVEKIQTFFNTAPTNTPTPTSPPSQSSGNYQYPGSTKINDTTYKSTADPDAITEWYREQLAKEGMSATSVIKTKANEKVINKIVAANSSKNVSIEITRDPGQTETTITVSVTSS